MHALTCFQEEIPITVGPYSIVGQIYNSHFMVLPHTHFPTEKDNMRIVLSPQSASHHNIKQQQTVEQESLQNERYLASRYYPLESDIYRSSASFIILYFFENILIVNL
ncbi:hypothetical protein ACJX0J_023140 [Zea mays]